MNRDQYKALWASLNAGNDFAVALCSGDNLRIWKHPEVLHLAVRQRNEAFLRLLRPEDLKRIDRFSACRLIEAATQRDAIDYLRLFLMAFPKGGYAESVYTAARMNLHQSCRLLLETHTAPEIRREAMKWAVIAGSDRVVQLLVELHVDEQGVLDALDWSARRVSERLHADEVAGNVRKFLFLHKRTESGASPSLQLAS